MTIKQFSVKTLLCVILGTSTLYLQILLIKERTKTNIPLLVPPLLVEKLIQVESGGNPKAKSKSNAMGLVQVRPATAKYILNELAPYIGPHTINEMYDPQINLIVGMTYLLEMYYRFGDLHGALTAYNRGPSNSAANKITNYSKRIMEQTNGN